MPRSAPPHLPHRGARQIVSFRAHRRFFTGDLASPVSLYPPLPGAATEAHLLRAAVADITAACTLSLAGLVEPDDDAAAEEPPVLKARARAHAYALNAHTCTALTPTSPFFFFS